MAKSTEQIEIRAGGAKTVATTLNDDASNDSAKADNEAFSHQFCVGLADQLFSPSLSEQQLRSIPPISLAYIGDAVFELYVRSRLLIPAKRIRDFHKLVVSQVKSEQQACHLECLLPYLNDAEKDVLRRGRNATTGRNRRAKAQDYQKSTAFEALIGFLYLSDQARLFELFQHLDVSMSD